MKAIKHLKRFIKQRILNEGNKPSYMVSEKSIRLVREEASKIVDNFYDKIENISYKKDTIKLVDDFFHLYYKRPIKNNIG